MLNHLPFFNSFQKQIGNIQTADARTLTVMAWEKSMLNEIAKGIMNANLGLNPQNNGDMIIIAIPPLTEERRKDLVKTAKAAGETGGGSWVTK